MNNNKPSLDRLALLAKERTTLLAGPLNLYMEQEKLDDQQLAAMLHCEPAAITRLALCERPRPNPHFREDVERIARYIHADFLQVAMVIRAAESRAAFSTRASTSLPSLLAARDRVDEVEDKNDIAHMDHVNNEDHGRHDQEPSDG